MPVRINEVFDENAFDSGTADFSIGNAGQWKKRTIRVYAGIATESTQTNTLTMRPANIYGQGSVERVNGSWIDDGFKTGDSINVSFNASEAQFSPQQTDFTATVLDITDTMLFIDYAPDYSRAFPSNAQHEDSNGDLVTYIWNWLLIYKVIRPDEVSFKFNQIPNDDIDGVSMNSIIDGSQTVLICNDLDPTDTTTFRDMTQIGNKSGMTILNPKARGFSVGSGVSAWKSFYEISFYYKISGEFDDLGNFIEDNNSPDYYLNDNCLSNNYLFEFRSAESDPNYTMFNDLNSKATKKLGNTGWKNENYNGLPVASSITDIQYRVSDETRRSNTRTIIQ